MQYVGIIAVICFTSCVSGRAVAPNELRVWHPNGTLRSEGTNRGGEKDGTFRYYDSAGNFTHQAYFYRGTQIWHSSERADDVPADTVARFAATYRWGTTTESSSSQLARTLVPLAFATLDRTTAARRLGAQIGAGGGTDLKFMRLDAFATYQVSNFGVYGQVTQSFVGAAMDSYLTGKSALDVGGTYRHGVREIPVTFRLGLMLPLLNDDEDGFVGGAAGSLVRPADAVMSFPSSTATRASASAVHTRLPFIVQADAGVDVAIGKYSLTFEPLARANIGVGIGNRSRLLSLELTNTMRLLQPTQRLHAIAVGGTYRLMQVSITGTVSVTTTGHAAAITSVGYDL